MKISTKGRYALELLIDLANNQNGEYISLKTISERQKISFKYLEKIATILVKNNLLEVFRGKQGGYRLIKNIEEYTVGEVLKLTEKSMESVECITHPETCRFNSRCKKHLLFKNLDEVIDNYLKSVTLKDII